MSINVKGYIDTINTPWGKLFYRLVWSHMSYSNKKIVDYGSGLGITANHLALTNDVIAIEPNQKMVENRITENEYRQVSGSIEMLRQIPDNSIDVIVCHNVLEYVEPEERPEILTQFVRILKPDGCVSVIKHHRAGKIMQKIVSDNRIDEALKLLSYEDTESVNFGLIREYEDTELCEMANKKLHIDQVYGLRTFYALQRNEWKYETEWLEKMYQMERAVEEIPVFRDIAFFHHLILRPIGLKNED